MRKTEEIQAGNWFDIHESMVLKTAVLFFAVAWFGWYRSLAAPSWDGRITLLIVASVGTCLIAVVQGRLSPAAKGMVQVAVSFAAAYTCQALLGYQVALAFLVLPLLLAACMFPLSVAVALALVACLITWLSPSASREVLWAYHLLYLSATSLVALLIRDLREALGDAWGRVEIGVGLVREVRARQQEINRLNKALNVSNGLLKRSLSELALAQKEADEARHLKEQFATTVSHELRTPLNIILGFVEVMQQYPEVYGEVNWTPTLRRDIGEIQHSAKYLSSLVDDILDLARIQALKMPIHREPTDLRRLIEEVVSLTARLLLEKDEVHLAMEVPDGLPTLYVDRTRIRQVLLNLLANACRFVSEGSITVRASLSQDEVLVSVADTGPGIPGKQLETIFEEFQQGGAGESLSGGKGLGLAIAKRFVQMHGGRIWAESKLGRGSTFHFSLPLVEKQVISLSAPPLQQALEALERPSVVLVDEGEGQAFLARHLEGYEVVTAPDLVQARRLVRERHPWAVIVNVPPEAEDATQGASPPILPEPVPVIQCSFPVGRWFVEKELFDDWLVKPIKSERLLQALRQAEILRGSAGLGGLHQVLVVDDDRALVRLVTRMLETQTGRFEVLAAYDGQQALDILRQRSVDTVLLDIALPGLDGRSVARAVRKEYAGKPTAVIAVTALQPGLEGPAMVPRSFSVTSSSGFGEEDILALTKACLARLRPAFTPESLGPEPEAEPDATPAS